MKQFPTIKTDNLVPYARNARTHSAEQVDQICASIREFGWTNPILVADGCDIIAGHGRIMAANKLGIDEVPCVDVSHLSKQQRKALIIADNKLALNSGWDDEMLRLELQELDDMGFDLELTGFGADELDDLMLDSDCEVEMPELADGEKEPFQQKTFTLHDSQADCVEQAITLARSNPLADVGVNENQNGNAIALICREWLEANHG